MPGGGHGAAFFVAVYTLRLEGLDGGSKAAGIARVDPQEAHMARVLPGKNYLGESYISFLVFCCSMFMFCEREGCGLVRKRGDPRMVQCGYRGYRVFALVHVWAIRRAVWASGCWIGKIGVTLSRSRLACEDAPRSRLVLERA